MKLDTNLIFLMKDLFNYIKNNAYFTVGNTNFYLQKEGLSSSHKILQIELKWYLDHFMATTSYTNRYI